MRQILSSVGVLLLAVGIMMLATGMFGTFIGLRSALEGFSQEVVGLMMSGYYAGLIVGTLYCGQMVNRIGHIRAFAAFCALIAAASLAFPFAIYAPSWIGLRAVIGFCMAGLFMVVESWLNARSTGKTRGTVLSLYMMITYLAMGSGQFVLNLGNPQGLELFMIASLLFSLALVPVAMTRTAMPTPVEASHFGFRKLYQISPTAVIGCLCAGLSSGAVYGMGPIYAKNLGLSVAEISQFMGIIIISGLVLQLPIGRLSDRYDRRTVLTFVALAASVTSFALVVWMYLGSYKMMTPAGEVTSLWQKQAIPLQTLAAIYGGFIATVYPLSIAYANDYIEPKDVVQATGGLVLAFSIGAAIGPVSAAGLMGIVGPRGLFIFTGATALLLVGFAVHRMRRRHWAPVTEKESFVLMPEATALSVATELDPRSHEEVYQLELDLKPPSSPVGDKPSNQAPTP